LYALCLSYYSNTEAILFAYLFSLSHHNEENAWPQNKN